MKMEQNDCQNAIIVKKSEDLYHEVGRENLFLQPPPYEDRKFEPLEDTLIADSEAKPLNDNPAVDFIAIEESDDEEMEIDIKRENLIKPDVKSNMVAECYSNKRKRVYIYKCHFCKEQNMKNFQEVVKHLLERHGITHHNKFIKHIKLEPDVDDPNYYCRSCEKKHSTLAKYKFHLKQIHRIHIKPMFNPRNKDVIPDADDPNFFCASCERRYHTEEKYHTHLKGYHKMKLKSRLDPEITPDWDDPDYYCKSCKRKYCVKHTYWKHLQVAHHMVPPEIRFPDPNNPDLHCNVCDLKYEDYVIYRDHCRKKHRMKLKPLQNFECNKCNRKYLGEHSFMKHLRLEHKIIDDMCYAVKRKPFNGITPDFDDPNFRCRACQKNFTTKTAYHYHLLSVHTMSVPSPGVLKPILNDPNHYCRCCKRKYVHKYRYRQHLSMVHKMELPPLRRPRRFRRKRVSRLNPVSQANQGEQKAQQTEELQIGDKDANMNQVSQNANGRKQTTAVVRISDKDAFIEELACNTDIPQTNNETQTSRENQNGAEVEASGNEKIAAEIIDKDGNVDKATQNADISEMNEEIQISRENEDGAKVEAGSSNQIIVGMQIDEEIQITEEMQTDQKSV